MNKIISTWFLKPNSELNKKRINAINKLINKHFKNGVKSNSLNEAKEIVSNTIEVSFEELSLDFAGHETKKD